MAKTKLLPIRLQLNLLLLALGLPFLVFLVVSALVHARHEREHAGQDMLALARVTAARLDDHVGDVTQALAVLGEVVGVTAADEDSNDALLTRLTARLPPQTNNVTVFSLDGRIVGSLDPRMRSTTVDLGTRSFFLKALSRSGLAVQAPFTSAFNGEPVGVFAMRIERAGKVVGVVSMGTRLRQLQDLVASPGSIPPGAVTTITSSDGVVLARSIDPEKWIGKSLLQVRSGFEESRRAGEGVRDGESADGVKRIAGFTTARRVPWLVYVGLPAEQAIAATDAQLRESLAAGALMLLLGVVVSTRVARRISAPLRQLQQDASAIEAGDLSRRTNLAGRGEIMSLANTLNQMTGALRQRESSLQASEEQLADLYANAPCGYHSLDATGRFVRINDTELRWLGCSREDVVGTSHFTDFLTPDGQRLFAQGFERLKADGRIDGIEFELQGRGGKRRHVIASASVIRDSNGAFESTRTVLYDISELQIAREALRQLTQEQRTILDTDLVGILKLKNRRIAWCNLGAERLLGHAPGALIGLSTRVYYPDDESFERLGLASRQMLASGKPFRSQLQLAKANGDTLWVDLSGIITAPETGEILCLMVDVTEQRGAEEARMRSHSLEMENRQLREASRFKSLFLSNMSHELRTPLNAVVGYAHLLRTGLIKPETDAYRAHLDKLSTGARELEHMIGAMLDFARADAEEIEFDPQPARLTRVVQTAAMNMQSAMDAKRIDLVVDVDPEVDAVVIDQLRLVQVLSVYLSNAVKFSREGGVVELRVRACEPMSFLVEVQDHGLGIPDADLPRLFTMFHQMGERSVPDRPGAGIGLALARKLIESQGGRVGVSSRLAFGSTFSLVLPREPARIA